MMVAIAVAINIMNVGWYWRWCTEVRSDVCNCIVGGK